MPTIRFTGLSDPWLWGEIMSLRDETDRTVPDPAAPIRLVYSRATARYWVYERPETSGQRRDSVQGLPDTIAVIHRRQHSGRRPDHLMVTIVEGWDQANVVGGRFEETD